VTIKIEQLRLDDGWRNVFRHPDVDTTPEFAVPYAVQEINQQANREPDYKSQPSEYGQTKHQRQAQDHANDWKHRHEWNAEWSRARRVSVPQDRHTNADQNKCE
jgi:hypothetical protein